MSNKRYVFIQPTSQSIYVDTTLPRIKFYQICAFPNPQHNMFEVREIIIGENNEISNFRDLKLEKKSKKKLIGTLKENQYRLFSTYSLRYITMPTCADISMARSFMINNDSAYTGYAAFV